MKLKRSLLIAALTTAAAGSALAQSSATVWGRLNTTVERQKTPAGNVTNVTNNASRLGFRGTEDLGGGLKANFLIEHRFNSDDGAAAATFWAGQAEVNLQSSSLGTIRLGRFTSDAYFATADYVSLHNHDTGTSADALYYSAAGWNSNNKVGYRSPEIIPGLVFEAAIGAGEGVVEKYGDVAVNYTMGALALGAGFEKQGDNKQAAVRALYSLGDFTFGGYYQRADDGVWGSRNTGRLVGKYAFGASELHANVGYSGDWGSVAGDSGAKQYTVGYNYNLSKRTKVYGFVTKVSADAASPSEVDFRSVALGVRHNF